MFKGRFGDFYLAKVWAFILIIGSIIFPFLHFELKGDSKFMIGIIEFIFFEIFLGFFISIPSLLISNIFYIIMSKQKFSDIKVFAKGGLNLTERFNFDQPKQIAFSWN